MPGEVGDGERIEPQFFYLFPELGIDPTFLFFFFFFFPKIEINYISGLMPKVIVFLSIRLRVVEGSYSILVSLAGYASRNH